MYLNVILNYRCLSIPITLRCLYNKASTYKPELDESLKTKPAVKPNQRPLTLLMPSLSQIQNLQILPSPHLNSASPSTYLNFSANGLSPGTPMFPFDPTQKVSSRKRRSSISSVASTPCTPGSSGGTPNKLKLPKITLKRKRNKNSEIYEIDQTKSDLNDGIMIKTEDLNLTNPTAFTYPSQIEGGTLHKMETSNPLFPDTVSFNDLTMEADSDIDNLLGIPSEPFIHSETLHQGIATLSLYHKTNKIVIIVSLKSTIKDG